MLVRNQPPLHLTYCMNIHPGESWEEVFDAVQHHAVAIGDRVAGGKPFGLGLRLSARAAETLCEGETLSRFKAYLDDRRLYVFTINGFPYGTFHGRPVKAEVYRPDWTHSARLDYTRRLADILSELLPEGVNGGISTVPGAYRDGIRTPDQLESMVNHFLLAVRHMAALRARTGKTIHLGIEPEPDCLIATVADCIGFFNDHLLPRASGAGIKERDLRRHLGVCLDLCHAAVMFENPVAAIQRLQTEGILLSKVQLSAGLEVPGKHRDALADFNEPVYLHQTGQRTSQGIIHHPDLPQAMAAPAAPSDLFRVHFHVPLHWNGAARVEKGENEERGTRNPEGIMPTSMGESGGEKTRSLFALLVAGATEHLEIETYTFDVLPGALRMQSVDDSIAAEFEWTKAQLTCCNSILRHRQRGY